MMAELEKTVKGLQAGTAADSQQVGQILPLLSFNWLKAAESSISWIQDFS